MPAAPFRRRQLSALSPEKRKFRAPKAKKIALLLFGTAALLFLAGWQVFNALLAPLPAIRENFAKLAGFGEPARWLLLFQNPAELRPTGGFLTALGEVEIRRGLPRDLKILDSYAIPAPEEKRKAPAEMAELFGIDPKFDGSWWIRDANWAPDFETAVAAIESFLPTATRQQPLANSQQPTANSHFALAADLSFLENLLEILDGADAGGRHFTKENLFAELAAAKGEADMHDLDSLAERKGILAELGRAVLKKATGKPARWMEIARETRRALDEKHLLLFAREEEIEEDFREAGWAGELTAEEELWLAPVFANLGGGKTDRWLQRRFETEISLGAEGRVEGKTRISLEHLGAEGKETPLSGDWRGNFRLFAAPGIELVEEGNKKKAAAKIPLPPREGQGEGSCRGELPNEEETVAAKSQQLIANCQLAISPG